MDNMGNFGETFEKSNYGRKVSLLCSVAQQQTNNNPRKSQPTLYSQYITPLSSPWVQEGCPLVHFLSLLFLAELSLDIDDSE
jgi:hypothetical protein